MHEPQIQRVCTHVERAMFLTRYFRRLQASVPRIDCRVNAGTSLPIVIMCFAEAIVSKKITSPLTIITYGFVVIGQLVIVLRKQAWNEKLARTGWQVQNEMRKEKETMSMILLDMLPRKYADQIIEKNGDCGGGTKHTAVILYSDLQGFTSMSERMKPREVRNSACLLNSFSSQATFTPCLVLRFPHPSYAGTRELIKVRAIKALGIESVIPSKHLKHSCTKKSGILVFMRIALAHVECPGFLGSYG